MGESLLPDTVNILISHMLVIAKEKTKKKERKSKWLFSTE
ncbi:hypothetical protein HMPREF9626_0966 [Streptococcus parasanguinis F0405]|uniref:Uncharacterized protein n=1 Tax=Streptococcus parasanguinis F0405 TaxID=905067 RepID=E3CFG4_STRPA|nr:hypothetical protein HMPREF9626_0966 [Streptococcus parasanguinis F0405]